MSHRPIRRLCLPLLLLLLSYSLPLEGWRNIDIEPKDQVE